jgi:hypothetical protein
VACRSEFVTTNATRLPPLITSPMRVLVFLLPFRSAPHSGTGLAALSMRWPGSAQELDLNGTTFNDPVPIVLRSSCTPESTRSISAIQLGMRLTWTGLLLLQPSCLDCPGTEKIASAGELSFGGTVLFRETTNSRTRGHVTVIGTCAVCLCGREPPVPCTLTGCVAAAQHALAWPRCQDEGLSFPPGTG